MQRRHAGKMHAHIETVAWRPSSSVLEGKFAVRQHRTLQSVELRMGRHVRRRSGRFAAKLRTGERDLAEGFAYGDAARVGQPPSAPGRKMMKVALHGGDHRGGPQSL